MDNVMYSYQGIGVVQPDPVEMIEIKWDGTKWIKEDTK